MFDPCTETRRAFELLQATLVGLGSPEERIDAFSTAAARLPPLCTALNAQALLQLLAPDDAPEGLQWARFKRYVEELHGALDKHRALLRGSDEVKRFGRSWGETPLFTTYTQSRTTALLGAGSLQKTLFTSDAIYFPRPRLQQALARHSSHGAVARYPLYNGAEVSAFQYGVVDRSIRITWAAAVGGDGSVRGGSVRADEALFAFAGLSSARRDGYLLPLRELIAAHRVAAERWPEPEGSRDEGRGLASSAQARTATPGAALLVRLTALHCLQFRAMVRASRSGTNIL